MDRQFTATVYILKENKTLLIFHKKLQKWLPPGGHLEPNEIPSEGAKREAFEETGLEIAFIQQENVWIEQWNAKSFPRPYMCLIEEIPAFGDQKAHQHIDFIYVATVVSGFECQNERESEGIVWFSLDELEALKPDVEIFVETLQTLKTLLLIAAPNLQ